MSGPVQPRALTAARMSVSAFRVLLLPLLLAAGVPLAAAPAQAMVVAGPASLVAQARMELIRAGFDARSKVEATTMIGHATALLDRALEMRPDDPDALVQKGIGVGYVAKLEHSPGLAKQSRRLFEAALARAPNDDLAVAALAGWHGGSVATLGRFMAGAVLGARRDAAITGFERALKLAPRSPIHPTYYAFNLLDLGDDGAGRARAVLATLPGMAPRDRLEAEMKRRGLEMLAALERGDTAGARALSRRLQPFGQIG